MDKILPGIEQMTRADQKINPLQGKIQSGGLLRPYQKRNRLAERHCKKFFQFVQAFSIKLKLRGFVNICMVEDRIQDLDSAICGLFQINFYENLFSPNEKSKIQEQTKLTKKSKNTFK